MGTPARFPAGGLWPSVLGDTEPFLWVVSGRGLRAVTVPPQRKLLLSGGCSASPPGTAALFLFTDRRASPGC